MGITTYTRLHVGKSNIACTPIHGRTVILFRGHELWKSSRGGGIQVIGKCRSYWGYGIGGGIHLTARAWASRWRFGVGFWRWNGEGKIVGRVLGLFTPWIRIPTSDFWKTNGRTGLGKLSYKCKCYCYRTNGALYSLSWCIFFVRPVNVIPTADAKWLNSLAIYYTERSHYYFHAWRSNHQYYDLVCSPILEKLIRDEFYKPELADTRYGRYRHRQ